MPLIWMEAGLPPMWLMALWPATPLTTVHLTASGAVAEKSPPFCVFIRDDAVRKTAASTANASTDAASVRRAGGGLPATLWCVSPPPADPMASARLMVVSATLDGEGPTAVTGAPQVSTATPAPKPALVLTPAPVIPSTDAASALLVSTVKLVKKPVLWVSSVRLALRSVAVTTCAHVTRRQEAVTPHYQRRPTTPYTELDSAWPNRCLRPGGEKKKLTESSLI